MSKETETAEVYACDACGKRFVILPSSGGDLPDGFWGTAYETGSWGRGPSADWFACKASHIRKAVESALAVARDAL